MAEATGTEMEQLGEVLAPFQPPAPTDDEPGEEIQPVPGEQLDEQNPQPDPEPGPVTFASLAEQVGGEEALYALEIPPGDGREEPLTLGELKDLAGQALTLDERSAALDERQREAERDLMADRQVFNSVVQMLPELPEDLVAEAQRQVTEAADSERKKLLQAKPDWKDPATYDQARGLIAEQASKYGFSQAEADFVIDHRLLVMVHDFAELERQLETARTTIEQMRESTQNPPRPSERQPGTGGDPANTQTQQRDVAAAKAGNRHAEQRALSRLGMK